MVANKKRLHIALYPSGVSNNEERKYHWAFLVGPKLENKQQVPGMKYHVKNHPVSGWAYEEVGVDDVGAATNLLARLTIAKIKDEKRLVEIFRGTPVVQHDSEWRCRSWTSEVLKRLGEDGTALGTSWLEWKDIEPLGREYVGKKTAAGRYAKVEELAPTWDILEGKETVA